MGGYSKVNNTKKLVMAITLASTLIGSVSAAESLKDIKIEIDGKNVISDVAPFINNERTLVPIRVISENLGYNVNWDNQTRKVTVKNSDKTIELFIGKKNVSVNGKDNSIDVAPMIKNERTFVPLRFISESFDNDVNWDKDTRTVKINKKEKTASSISNKSNSIINDINNVSKSYNASERYIDYSEHNRKVVEDYYNRQKDNSYNYKPSYIPETVQPPKQNTYISDNDILKNIHDNVKIHSQLIQAQTVSGLDFVGTLKNNTDYTIKEICVELLLDNGKVLFYNTNGSIAPYGNGTLSVLNNVNLIGTTKESINRMQLVSVEVSLILPSGEERMVYTQNNDVVYDFIYSY